MNRNSNDLEKHIISLEDYGIINAKINYNLSVESLYNICVNNNQGVLTNKNVLAINTGKFTGRSPKDRYIVSDKITKEKVWWGEINRPIDESLHAQQPATACPSCPQYPRHRARSKAALRRGRPRRVLRRRAHRRAAAPWCAPVLLLRRRARAWARASCRASNPATGASGT